jgi:hypothetical protein
MNNYIEIIEKLKDILSKEIPSKKIYDKDVSSALGITSETFRKQKSRKSIPYLEIMQFLAKRNISINWFFFSQLLESLIESTSNYIILKYQRSITATAGGGGINYEVDTVPLVIDKQLLDHINSSYKYTEMLQVFGESMEPDIKEGSLVFVDKSKTELNNKDIYVVNTQDGLFIKMLSIYDNSVTLISNNKVYHNITYDRTEIDVIGRVCGVLIEV